MLLKLIIIQMTPRYLVLTETNLLQLADNLVVNKKCTVFVDQDFTDTIAQGFVVALCLVFVLF